MEVLSPKARFSSDYRREVRWAFDVTSDATSFESNPLGWFILGEVEDAAGAGDEAFTAAVRPAVVRGAARLGLKYGALTELGAVGLGLAFSSLASDAGMSVGSMVSGLMLMPPIQSYYGGFYHYQYGAPSDVGSR